MKAEGIGPVYVGFLKDIADSLKYTGKRFLFWGDVAMNHPELVKNLPKDMIAVAWRCENVYFENSFYHFAPGAGVIVEAANSMIGDKLLYASAYPFVPLGETLEKFRTLPFLPEVADKVLYRNADALLARIGKRLAGTG